MEKLRHYDWSLIAGLGCLALAHPLLNVSGLMSLVGRPHGPWLLTALISAIWVATVVLGQVRAPLATLALTGLAAGLAVLAVSAVLPLTLGGSSPGLFASTVGVVAVLVTNTLWGSLAGLLALGLQRALRVPSASRHP